MPWPVLRADMATVRVAACLRLAAVVGVAAVGSYGSHSERAETLFVLLGLVGVPWATLVLLAADRPGSTLALLGGPIGDAATLFTVHLLSPGSGNGLLLGYLVVVAFAAYTAGRSVAAPLAATSLLLLLGAEQLRSGPEAIGAGEMAAFAAALLALVFLLDRTVALQQRASARSSRLEGKADAILARVADCVVVTDVGGRVLQTNAAAERLVGLPGEKIVGRGCGEVLGLRVGEGPMDCSQQCALLGLAGADGAGQGHETWRVDTFGRRQPLLANAEAVTDDHGRPVEVVHSLRDITQLKQAEEAKTLFLATASHELKTPLTVIKGFADTLLAFPDFDPDRRAAALQAIGMRSAELARIVDRLLLSSRIEAGQVRVNVARVVLAPLVLERARALESATGRQISAEIDLSLPEVVADASALITVIDHLLDNALKYSPGGEDVAVRAIADDGAVRIEVEDAGVGMDGEQVARCFDKFWQAESTDVRRFGGTGIGLYIVRSLVEAMGGRVSVRSVPGAGSTFSISLPREPVDTAVPDGRGVGEPTSIREFMRQIGVPERSGT